MARDEIQIASRPIEPAVLHRPSRDYFSFLEQVHGLLENTPADIKEERLVDFALRRLAWLESEAKPLRLSVFNRTFHKGFIHPESDVLRNEWSEALRLDDIQLYVTFLKAIDAVRQEEAWQGKPIRDVVAAAMQETMGLYFGTFAGDEGTEKRNEQFYHELGERAKGSGARHFSIAELRDKGVAVCVEKAAAAQNLLAFKGLDTYLVFSAKCSVKGTPHEPPHVYNIVHSDRGFFIYDPTNPSVMKKPHGEIVSYRPAIYEVSREQFDTIAAGGSVVVTHKDYLVRDSGEEAVLEKRRTYAGP